MRNQKPRQSRFSRKVTPPELCELLVVESTFCRFGLDSSVFQRKKMQPPRDIYALKTRLENWEMQKSCKIRPYLLYELLGRKN